MASVCAVPLAAASLLRLDDGGARTRWVFADAPIHARYTNGVLCPLVHSPEDAVDQALRLTHAGSEDVLLDLGCGDGRVLVAAARAGVRAIGIDVRRDCLVQSRAAAERAGMSQMVEVVEGDLTHLPTLPAYSRATILYAYLTRKIIEFIEPMLLRAVDEGKRVIIYCTSGCEPNGAPTPGAMRAGNALGDLEPAAQGMLGMLRVYQRADATGEGTSLAPSVAKSTSAVRPSSSPTATAAAAAAMPPTPAPDAGDGDGSSSPSEPPAPESAPGAPAPSASRWVVHGTTGDDGVRDGEFDADFAATAAAMDSILRRALVDDEVADDDTELVTYLTCEKLVYTRCVLRRAGAISPSGCAALRKLVDDERDVTRDSVDHKAQHQLNIGIDALIGAIGRPQVEALWRLADEVLATQRAEWAERARRQSTEVPHAAVRATEAADGGFHVDLFVRRYTRETRPWIAFHHDVSTVTVNVALNADATFEGGRLHAIVDARHTIITREEGEATAHGDDVMHAVSAMRSGTRYSLIMFFYALADDADSLEYQTIPKRDLERQAEGEVRTG